MFFSDDLLVGKKGSKLGLVWLMATLGPRNRRVSRKAITGLEISSTCDLIAMPPEPMALRLSGHLLVGVARVFNQTCDIFYTDCQNFKQDIKRAMLLHTRQRKNESDGLDMPGGGTSRTDHITFPQVEFPQVLFGFDLEFSHVEDWRRPLGNKRSRRASSKLSLQPSYVSGAASQSQLQNIEEVGSGSESDDPDTEESRNPKRPRTNHTDRHLSVEPFIDRQTPLPEEPSSFEPLNLDILPEDEDPAFNNHGISSDIDDRPLIDLDVDAFHVDVPQDELPGESNDGVATGPEKDGPLPAKKPRTKRTKKPKALGFDDLIEIGTQPASYNYKEDMLQHKKEKTLKKNEAIAALNASLLVDGGGCWLHFMDPDMAEFFKSITKAPKFQWELDVEAHKQGKSFPADDIVDPIQAQNVEDLPWQDVQDVFNPPAHEQDQPFIDPFQFTGVPENNTYDTTHITDEIGRRVSTLPWAEEMREDSWTDLPPGPNSDTPGTNRRISIMTPLERRLRSGAGDSTGSNLTRRRFRSRSGSVLSITSEHRKSLLLWNDEGDPGDGIDLLEDELPTFKGAFSPAMLALLERQCRDFFSFVEKRLITEETDEMTFDEVLPVGTDKHIAASAFHNVLTLATKRIFSVAQDDHFGPITLRIAAEA